MPDIVLVRDLMTVGVPTCKNDTPVAEIARLLLDLNTEGVCVLDNEGSGLGVVGFEELAAVYGRENARDLKAEDVMREGMPTLPADMPLPLAAQFMRDQHTRIAYMTHNSAGIIYPAAYITYRHLLRHLAAKPLRAPEHLRPVALHDEREPSHEAAGVSLRARMK